jgi:transposase
VLMELSAVDQRYEAVNEVVRHNLSVTEVAARYGVTRQTLHEWIRRYADHGVAGLVERSHRPASCPHQMSKIVEARIVALRAHNPHWGPASIAYQLMKEGIDPVPGHSSIYRALLRHDLVGGVPRKRRRQDYLRWERSKPMQLWQQSITRMSMTERARGDAPQKEIIFC